MNKWIIFMVFLVIMEATSDIIAKEWSLRGVSWIAFVAITSYAVTNVFWLMALKNGVGLAKGAVIFSVASAILGIIIGLLFYREQVSNLQILGIILGVIAFTLILWE